MSISIIACLIIVFFIGFSFFFIFNEIFPYKLASDVKDHEFFKNVEDESKKVLILGGSGAVQLNTTLIDKRVSGINKNLAVYNLAYNADTPKQRYSSIEPTLDLEPKIVFYGITYFDLNGFEFDTKNQNKKILPNVKQTFFEIFNIKDKKLEEINPKAVTMNFLKDKIGFEKSNSENTIKLPNSPFSSIDEYQTIISDPSELNVSSEKVRNHVKQDENTTTKQKKYLKKIIEKFLENNVKVVFFTLPHHQLYLEQIPESDKNAFYNSLSELEKEYDIVIYDFQELYGDMNIWQDSSHVAFNKDSMVFSIDIAKIIILEVQKDVI